MILWCMSRGSATESPAGHLISRRGPRTSLPFSQETGPQVLGSSLHRSISKKGGSRAGTQGFPLEQHPLPAGKGSHILQLPESWEQKLLVGGVLSPSCGATSGSVPYLELWGGESAGAA